MTWQVLVGDVLDRLADLDDASVQTVVTSPPYWGLRDYGTAAWDGGDAVCEHVQRMARQDHDRETPGGRGGSFAETPIGYRDTCGKCGARRVDQQLGLEPTPEAYVERLVEVFREVRRVLRDDGTVWLNLGDSYAGSGKGPSNDSPLARPHRGMSNVAAAPNRWQSVPAGVKPKDLVGIPWMVAFALRADGWYLRSDIIWAKPNPMPESVGDRPTSAHEHVFLIAKAERYFYDYAAVREPNDSGPADMRKMAEGKARFGGKSLGNEDRLNAANVRTKVGSQRSVGSPDGRNLRNVWTLATEPFPGAHFATFPKRLVEPCVKAGSAEGDTVLDPFCGSGTVGVVAARLGRSFVGIELNPDYAEMARERIRNDGPLFNVSAEVVA